MNIIDFLSKNYAGELIVLTTKNNPNNQLSVYKNESSNVIIKRMRFSGSNLFIRLIEYFLFYLESLISIFRYNAKTVFYFESISSWPALIYKRIKGKGIQLMVHYHEYTDPESKEGKTFLSTLMQKIEKRMYQRFSWISQTNEVRLNLFKENNDLNHLPASLFHILPNYPSCAWMTNRMPYYPNRKAKKLVFVGSLGYKNMYLQEMINWLGNHPDEFSLDIYAYNMDEKAKQILENNQNENIRNCGGCDYWSLPGILKNYDIGLVIYKPFSQNTIHAVSNKVFEYLACGLDVWFSEDMTYTFKYVKKDVYPKVIPVNFNQLNSFDFESAIARENLRYEPGTFFYENIYPEILDCISGYKVGTGI